MKPSPRRKPDERHAQALGGLHREVARGGDGGEDRDAGDGRLLDELEAGPARDQHDPVVERQLAGEQPAPDQLVQRVVPADVLAHRDERPVGVEQAGRVEAAGGARTRPGASRRRAGSASSVSGVTTGPSGIGAQRTSTSSSDALPQMPHDAVATKWRSAMPAGVEGAGEADGDLVVGLGVGRPGRRASMETMSAAAVDQALRAQEAGRELRLVTRACAS